MNAPASLTINFDSNIISITGPSNMSGTITTSGEFLGGSAADGMGYKFTVALQDGYIIDSISTELNEYCGYLDRFGADYFWIVAEAGGINGTITITSKLAVSRKSVDLTTLTGWSSLPSDTYNITIVAKAENYRDSEPSAAVSVEKAAAMPAKGDIITLDSKQYRVLKLNGTVAEVLCMYDANSSIKFDSASSGYNNTYAGKNIDTFCNNTFYSGLSSAMKSAIVDKTFTQDSWAWAASVPTPSHYTGKYGSNTYYLTLTNAAFGTSITRHCYVLSVQDVLDYLDVTTSMGISDTTLSDTNLWKMIWNQTTSPGFTYPWLRSASSGNSYSAFYINGGSGSLGRDNTNSAFAVRPAFQIDLSKISWSK